MNQHHIAVDVAREAAQIRITDTTGHCAEVPLDRIEWLVYALIAARENLLDADRKPQTATVLPFKSPTRANA